MKTILLTKGMSTIVDDEDFEKFSGLGWYFAKGYAVRNELTPKGQRQVYLHRLIAGTPDGYFTDHISGDKLDNRKQNLRVVTKRQNNLNTKLRRDNSSGMKGVYYHATKKKWIAQIALGNGGQTYIGAFNSAQEAGNAYKTEAARAHGQFARNEQ